MENSSCVSYCSAVKHLSNTKRDNISSHFSSRCFESNKTVSQGSEIVSNFSFSIVLSDNRNTDGSRKGNHYKPLFFVFLVLFGGILLPVLFANRNRLWRWLNRFHRSASQTGPITLWEPNEITKQCTVNHQDYQTNGIQDLSSCWPVYRRTKQKRFQLNNFFLIGHIRILGGSCWKMSLKRYQRHLHLKRLPTLASVAR